MKAEEHPLSQKPLIERITKGDWTIRHGSGIEKVILSAGFGTICVLPSPANSEVMDEIEDEQKANAEAISSVPELLKAEQERQHLDVLLDEHVKESVAKDLKIQELEETLSAQEKKEPETAYSIEDLMEMRFRGVSEREEPTQGTIDFATWYSGMERSKVLKAYERYKKETLTRRA